MMRMHSAEVFLTLMGRLQWWNGWKAVMWGRETTLVVSVGEYSSRIPRYEGGSQKCGSAPLLDINQHHKFPTHP